MTKRSPVAVFILPLVTFGIYALVWSVKTKNEMNSKGASIPTAWLLIVPIANLFWLWKFSKGVETVTRNGLSGVVSFILLLLLGCIGMAVVQSKLNTI
jgi:hypothetical protein